MEFPRYCFSIDRGGTFTDVYALVKTGKDESPRGVTLKVLSQDASYENASYEAIRQIMSQFDGVEYPRNVKIDPSRIDWIRMGSTIATNALLEKNAVKVAFLCTKGFRDVLNIGLQARKDLFDLKARKIELECEQVWEIDERVIPILGLVEPYVKEPVTTDYEAEVLNTVDEEVPGASAESAEDFDRSVEVRDSDEILRTTASLSRGPVVLTDIGTKYRVVRRLNVKQVRAVLQQIYDEKKITSISVAFMHSYGFPYHEEMVGKIAREIGFKDISLSHSVSASNLFYARASTAYFDASLTPLVRAHLEGFVNAFSKTPKSVLFIQSDGGLVPYDEVAGVRSILSGPAGGVVGYSQTAYTAFGKAKPIIGFDMGGTSTDLSRYGDGLDVTSEGEVAGVQLHVPHLEIRSVAAGGGSKLFFRGGMFIVGPESAGAYPGPACYRNNGPLTVTDANVVLGRISAKYLPHVFGATKDQPIDIEASFTKMNQLTQEINQFNKSNSRQPFTVEQVALGYIRVANEAMTRPILAVTREKGYDTVGHVLACFGGAGGLHACQMAKSLDINHIYVHKSAGILSAYGLSLANVHQDIAASIYDVIPSNVEAMTKEQIETSEKLVQITKNKAIDQKKVLTERLKEKGFAEGFMEVVSFVSVRYEGSDSHIQLNLDEIPNAQKLIESFKFAHQKELGFQLNTALVVEQLRSVGIGKTSDAKTVPAPFLYNKKVATTTEAVDIVYEDASATSYFHGVTLRTGVYDTASLEHNVKIEGPALICDRHTTILVEPSWTCHVLEDGSFVMEYPENKNVRSGLSSDHVISDTTTEEKPDAVTLAVFGHRFMGIAEQMGKMLQRISVSVNIKQRLDYSCAIFKDDGSLVANAPHIPAHLGAMGDAVKAQVDFLGDSWEEGDIVLVNHTQRGGTHLPDLSVITPVYANVNGERKKIMYLCSRGHHADIGGIAPGSIPSFSKHISEEGVAIHSFKIVEKGVLQLNALKALLGYRSPDWTEEEYKKYLAQASVNNNRPAFPPARRLDDNLNDLMGQIAANTKGITLIEQLIQSEGLDRVVFNMKHLQEVSAESVRELIVKAKQRIDTPDDVVVIQSEDYLDEGCPIRLKLTIDSVKRKLIFDFSECGPQVYGNMNTPPAITKSAIIYSLRCLVNEDMPLNQGFMDPVEVIFAPSSVLSPSEDAAVVAGNVLTSQRITDVIFQAFQALADSQGCMNNLTFGKEGIAFYETMGGGCGAGSTWHGTSGVHCHMSNTRITDSELIERKWPVVLHAFQLRPNSGGKGAYNGGNGMYREFEFLIEGLTVNTSMERRSRPPNGMKGGGNGKMGKNLWLRFDSGYIDNPTPNPEETPFRTLWLGGKNNMLVGRGDRVSILTPGGGGYGAVEA